MQFPPPDSPTLGLDEAPCPSPTVSSCTTPSSSGAYCTPPSSASPSSTLPLHRQVRTRTNSAPCSSSRPRRSPAPLRRVKSFPLLSCWRGSFPGQDLSSVVNFVQKWLQGVYITAGDSSTAVTDRRTALVDSFLSYVDSFVDPDTLAADPDTLMDDPKRRQAGRLDPVSVVDVLMDGDNAMKNDNRMDMCNSDTPPDDTERSHVNSLAEPVVDMLCDDELMTLDEPEPLPSNMPPTPSPRPHRAEDIAGPLPTDTPPPPSPPPCAAGDIDDPLHRDTPPPPSPRPKASDPPMFVLSTPPSPTPSSPFADPFHFPSRTELGTATFGGDDDDDDRPRSHGPRWRNMSPPRLSMDRTPHSETLPSGASSQRSSRIHPLPVPGLRIKLRPSSGHISAPMTRTSYWASSTPMERNGTAPSTPSSKPGILLFQPHDAGATVPHIVLHEPSDGEPSLCEGQWDSRDEFKDMVTRLACEMRPPYPGGQVGAFAARKALVRLGQASNWARNHTTDALYTHLMLQRSTARSILSTLIPPLSGMDDTRRHLRGVITMTARHLHVDSMPWTTAAANLQMSDELSPLTNAKTVSIGPEACQAIGESTMLARTLCALTQPEIVCIDAGPHGRLANFALGLLVLPDWLHLQLVKVHDAHTALVPGSGRTRLFFPGVEYVLAFGPNADQDTWYDMAALLRSLLKTFEASKVHRVQVILPFDERGTLHPQRPVPVPPRQPLAPLKMLPGHRAGPSVDTEARRCDDLTSIARRFVFGDKATSVEIDFLTVELFEDDCATCCYPWKASR